MTGHEADDRRAAYDRIIALEYACAACLDDDRLEAWPDFFVEDCVYNITTRENVEDGFPLGIFQCHNRAQLRDRVKILRNAAVFSLRYYRHLISNIRILAHDDPYYDIEAHYAVYATDVVDGTTEIFSTGKYLSKVIASNDGFHFKERVVIADTASIPKNLSVPL